MTKKKTATSHSDPDEHRRYIMKCNDDELVVVASEVLHEETERILTAFTHYDTDDHKVADWMVRTTLDELKRRSQARWWRDNR